MFANNLTQDSRRESSSDTDATDDSDENLERLEPLFGDMSLDYRERQYPIRVPWFTTCPNLSDQIINFDRAMKQYANPKSSSVELTRMREDSWTNLEWYNRASSAERGQVQQFLLELDRSKRVDTRDGRTTDIHRGITRIMKALTQKLEQLDRRFKGNLHKMGSSNNNTKVGEPNEFDFTYELDICTLLGDENASILLENGELIVQGADCPEKYDLFDFPADPELKAVFKDAHRYRTGIGKSGEHYTFNREHAAFAFFLLLEQALGELELPTGWSHGGAYRPRFSGVRFNFPAYLIQLYYEGSSGYPPLAISIDFAPMLRLASRPASREDILENFFKKNEYDKRQWLPLGQGYGQRAIFSYAEERFLSEYEPESVPKTLIRICKLLHSFVGLASPKYLPRDVAEDVADLWDGRADRSLFVWTLRQYLCMPDELRFVLPHDELATFNDMGEKVDGFEYITSYTFKRAVMTLLVLDPHRGKSWTQEDIPRLVLTVYLIINDVILSVQSQIPNIVSDKAGSPVTVGETALSLECYYKRNNDKVTAHSGKCDLNPPKVYLLFVQALKANKCPGFANLFNRERYIRPSKLTEFDLQLSRVFKLLKSVLERKPSVTFSIWTTPLNDREEKIRRDILKYFLRKQELVEILQKRKTK